MADIFLQIVNMSISASWIILIILLLRLALHKAPKWTAVLLWGIAAVRLICPFSVESVLSLMPSSEAIPPTIMLDRTPQIHTGVPAVNHVVNPILLESFTPDPAASANPLQILVPLAAAVWALGVAAMLIYTLISYLHIRRSIGTAVRLRDNIYQSERVSSPFVLGLIRPKIYLPFDLCEQDMTHVIAHEQAHIARRDHLWKPLGFVLLAVHWFNPLVWLGYILLCRDIELACDEKVIKALDSEHRADYSEALLTCSVNRRLIAACPLAFGEVGVKSRVRSVLSYKKPAFWIIIIAVVASIALGVCFLTNPKSDDPIGVEELSGGSELDGVSMKIIHTDLSVPDPILRVRWSNTTAKQLIFGEEFYIYRKTADGGLEDCRLTPNYVWHTIGYIVNPFGSATHDYHLNGLVLTQPGTYRLETTTFPDGEPDKEYTLWVEFELTDAVPTYSTHTFDPVELIYSDGMYSYVQSAEAAPRYSLTSGMQLQELAENGTVATVLGPLEETTLTENTFDSRFHDGVDDTLKAIKTHNKRAWQLLIGSGTRSGELYLLLEQDDGTFYLGCGYYSADIEMKRNPDGSHIRWLYKLAMDAPSASSHSGTVTPLITTADIEDLKAEYPSYFGLPVDNGLEVYIWQMAENSYSCGLLPAREGGYTKEELIDLHTASASLEDMRAIVSSYMPVLSQEDITVCPITMPHSSYHGGGLYINAETYKDNITKLFWTDFPILLPSDYSPVIDTASFDIDGDGAEEECTLTYGPTSGLFTVVLHVTGIGDEHSATEYLNTYSLPHGELSFVQTEDGMRLRVVPSFEGLETIDYEFEVKNGMVFLTADGEHASFWGGTQGIQ